MHLRSATCVQMLSPPSTFHHYFIFNVPFYMITSGNSWFWISNQFIEKSRIMWASAEPCLVNYESDPSVDSKLARNLRITSYYKWKPHSVVLRTAGKSQRPSAYKYFKLPGEAFFCADTCAQMYPVGSGLLIPSTDVILFILGGHSRCVLSILGLGGLAAVQSFPNDLIITTKTDLCLRISPFPGEMEKGTPRPTDTR